MGCGENCGCSAGNNEIVKAVDKDGKDITNEVTGKECSNPECKGGTCEKCSDSKEAHGDSCCSTER